MFLSEIVTCDRNARAVGTPVIDICSHVSFPTPFLVFDVHISSLCDACVRFYSDVLVFPQDEWETLLSKDKLVLCFVGRLVVFFPQETD